MTGNFTFLQHLIKKFSNCVIFCVYQTAAECFVRRMGLYFSVRQLLLAALEKSSSSKMPFLHSIVTKIVPHLNTADLDGAYRALQLMGDLVGRPPLVNTHIRPNINYKIVCTNFWVFAFSHHFSLLTLVVNFFATKISNEKMI